MKERKQIDVVCGVFWRHVGGPAAGDVASVIEVALFRRTDNDFSFEFPGGKVDPGETEEEALARELKEELNLEVETHGFLGENLHDYPEVRIRLRAFWVQSADWSPLQLVDHSEWRWSGAGDTGGLSAADVPLWDLIFENGQRPKV